MPQEDPIRSGSYSLRIATPDGRSTTFSVHGLTPQQVAELRLELLRLAFEAGVNDPRIEFQSIGDACEKLLAEARSFFKGAREPKRLLTMQLAVECVQCRKLVPLSELLESSDRVSAFLSEGPLPGDSRCDNCSRESEENCYECRFEWMISNDKSFRFLCDTCRAASPESKARVEN